MYSSNRSLKPCTMKKVIFFIVLSVIITSNYCCGQSDVNSNSRQYATHAFDVSVNEKYSRDSVFQSVFINFEILIYSHDVINWMRNHRLSSTTIRKLRSLGIETIIPEGKVVAVVVDPYANFHWLNES